MMRYVFLHTYQIVNNAKKQFDQLRSLRSDGTFGNGSDLQKLVKKCKEMARVVKAGRPISSYALPDFNSHVPSREIADPLVQLYFGTFESTYRILHRGLFFREYEQYWKDSAAGKPSFILKLLLILAIGSVFYDGGTNGNTLRSLAPQWIYASQSWLSAPFEKGRLNLVGIEIRCLIILARHTHSLENDLLWVSVGSLMRTAMSMGLHRDPSHFPKISVFHAELRRRLWATIIEIATQSSLDCGMPPMFSFHEFDCEPPSNYDDEDIDEQTKAYPPKKPYSVFTDTSVQLILLRSLPTRLELSRLINDFRSIPPYEKVLALSSELTSHIRSHAPLYHASQSSNHQFTTCRKSLLDLSTRRFLLALHHPFAIQAKTDPRYYFSRKVALDASMAILSHPPTTDPVEEFTLKRLLSGGFFEEIISRASATIALELINQINEDTSPSSTVAARKPLHDAMETLAGIMRSKLEFGVETNVKGYLFLSMVQAQTLAMESGEEAREAIVERAKVAAEESYGLLRRQVTHTPLDGQTPGSGREGIGGGTEENNVDWDLLVSGIRCIEMGRANELQMQDTMMDFDATNNWLFDSWEDAHNMG
jgi:Fungal specific transcription factor domain